MESSNQTLALLLAKTLVTDKNSKEHHKSKVNQKELSQLNRNISVPSLNWNKILNKKYFITKKTNSIKGGIT